LFGSKPSRAEPEPMRDIAALMAPLRVPAVHLVIQAAPSRSYFGGEPRLPGDVAWPQHDGVRLPFLARLSLAEVHATAAVPWLPSSGALLFFYDTAQQPWGFDPDDRGKFAVLHVPDLPASMAPSEAGAVRDAAAPNPRGIGMRRIDVLPSTDRDAVESLNLHDGELDAFWDLADAPFDGRPRHLVSGLPEPVQGDGMELECQLASHGINCGEQSGHRHPRAAELRPGASHWRLLMQVDSDDELGVMWGDGGKLYFWVEESAARAGDFSNAWVILQCH
jgi:uncharacterized protein YwqG